MKESTKEKGKRILAAMLAGRKITPYEANQIGETTEGTRFIRHIREKIEENPREPRYLKVVWGTGYKVG